MVENCGRVATLASNVVERLSHRENVCFFNFFNIFLIFNILPIVHQFPIRGTILKQSSRGLKKHRMFDRFEDNNPIGIKYNVQEF